MKKSRYIILLLCIVLHTSIAAQDKPINTNNTMNKFTLPALPYASDALSPVLSEQTINFHYGKHLQTYINNLNGLLPGSGLEDATLEQLICKAKGPLFNNAAQTWNHTFYFLTFAPEAVAAKAPTGRLLEAINKKWLSLDNFKKEFVTQGGAIFGSGWVWLVKDDKGELSIIKSANADNPIAQGFTPLLTFDVWEHSYYLDYQNRRVDHLNELWKIVDWALVDQRF